MSILIIAGLVIVLISVLITVKVIFFSKKKEASEIIIPIDKKLKGLPIILIAFLITGCFSAPSPVDELNKIRAELDKNKQELNTKDKSISEYKDEITKINQNYKELDKQSKEIGAKLQEIIKLRDSANFLNPFIISTLNFAKNLIKKIIHDWLWAIFGFAVFIALMTEFALARIPLPKLIISIIPALLILVPIFLLLKADTYCGITLMIISWSVANMGWEWLVNKFKIHKPVQGLSNMLLGGSIGSKINGVLNKIGEPRVKK